MLEKLRTVLVALRDDFDALESRDRCFIVVGLALISLGCMAAPPTIVGTIRFIGFVALGLCLYGVLHLDGDEPEDEEPEAE